MFRIARAFLVVAPAAFVLVLVSFLAVHPRAAEAFVPYPLLADARDACGGLAAPGRQDRTDTLAVLFRSGRRCRFGSVPQDVEQTEALLRRVSREQESRALVIRKGAEEQSRAIVVRARQEARIVTVKWAGLSLERQLQVMPGYRFM